MKISSEWPLSSVSSLRPTVGAFDGEELYTDCMLIEACASDDPRSIIISEGKVWDSRVNRFDEEAGFVSKRGMQLGFFYKSMHTIDSKARIITYCHVFNGKTFDSIPLLERNQHQKRYFQFQITRVIADTGFGFGPVIRGLNEIGIKSFIPVRGKVGAGKNGIVEGFQYHPDKDIYTNDLCKGLANGVIFF